MSDSEKFPLTKAFMQDLYDKFDAAYAALYAYRTVVDAAELYMPHLEINPQKRPRVGLTDDEIQTLIDDLRLNHEYCPKEVILRAADVIEQLLKEKNNG